VLIPGHLVIRRTAALLARLFPTTPPFPSSLPTRTHARAASTCGIGTVPQLAGELFNTMAGVHLIHVLFRGGGAALTSLLGGHVQVLFGAMPDSVE